MKKWNGTICAVALAGAMLLTGCGPAQAENNTPAARTAEQAAPAVTAAQDSAAEAPAGQTESPAVTAAPAPQLREFQFTTRDGGMNGIFTYDEQGRLEHIALSSRPDDYTDALDMDILYKEDGRATVSIDPEDTAGLEATPMMPVVDAITYQENGTLLSLEGYSGCLIYLEFNGQGLPAYFCMAQDDLGYRLRYTEQEDGTLALESAEYVFGHYTDHTDTPQSDSCTPTGTFRYYEG